MISILRDHIIPAAMMALPDRMDSPKARAFLYAIAMQESHVTYRRQIHGPARGLWQFEIIGIEGVCNHYRTRDLVKDSLEALLYPRALGPSQIYGIIEDNDILACCIARLLIFTIPAPLPDIHEPELAWGQYLAAWRPGSPRISSWGENYRMAWNV